MNQEVTQVAAARRRKALLFGTASALVMCATVPSRGWAQLYTDYPSTYSGPVNYPNNDTQTGPTASGYTTSVLQPVNSDTTLSATIANGAVGTTGAGTSAITTANSLTASAGGNDTTNSVTGTTLPLPNLADNDPDGVVLLTDAENTATVATARIANSYLAQVLTVDNSSAVANVTNNTMASSVTLNQSTTTLSGQVPVNYVYNYDNYSGAYSAINSFYDTGPNSYYNTYGSILATTAQFNTGSGELAGSNAMVTESYAGEILTGADSTPVVLNTSPAVTGNTFSAGFTGNSATTALTISAGGAPTLAGSAALANTQQNAYDTGEGTNPSAIVKYSFIGLGVLPGSGEDASIGLTGAAAVTGNTITATAIGNQAVGAAGSTGNILTLAGGIGVAGTATDQNNEVYFYGATPESFNYGDIVVNNLQSNLFAPLDSEVKQSGIVAGLLGTVSGTASVSSNTITAQTVGSEAYNGLLAPGLGTPGTGSPLNGEFALTSLQSNQGSPITATIYQAGSVLLLEEIAGGTATANANTATATATGNSVINTVSLNASSLPSYSGNQASTFSERNPIYYSGGEDDFATSSDFGAYADVTLLSLQQNDASSPVTATNTNSLVGIGTAAITSGAVSVTNNTAAALATGNAATNSLTLTAASVLQSAALVSAQSSYGAVTATLTDPITGFGTVEGVEAGASLAVTGNLQRAIATGNNASNLLSVAGSSIAVSNQEGPAAIFYYEPDNTFPFGSGTPSDTEFANTNQTFAGFIATNDQATTAPVTASVTFANPYSADVLYVGGDGLATSTAINSTNAVVAAARGSTATTQLTLAPTDSLALYDGNTPNPLATYSPFAVVTSAQTLTDGTTVTASIAADTTNEPPYLPPVYTQIAGGVTSSTVAMAGNQIETLAEGNDATNGLTLSGTATIAEAPASTENGIPLGLMVPLLSGATTTITADAAFTVQNMQYAGTGGVTSLQANTGVETAIGGDILNSTVMIGGATPLLGNTVAATATANTASNALTLAASNLSASAGLQNFQVSTGPTLATLGTSAGSIPTPGSMNTVLAYSSNVDNTGEDSGPSQVNNISYQSYTGWLTSADPNSTQDGFALGYGGVYYKYVTNYSFPQSTPVEVDTQTSFVNTIPASPGSPGSPGFVALLDGNVTNATIGITNNTVNATATSNAAVNTVAVTSSISSSALTFNYGENLPIDGFTGPGSYLNPVYGATVLADAALQNIQILPGGSTTTAVANGSFWISNAAVAPVYTNAVLSVSDNTQQAVATGNQATNSLSLSPGITVPETTSVTASLLSVQAVTSTAEVPVSATSTMLISAPLAMTDSTLTLSGNSNTASAIANDVTNTLTVTGTTSLPGYHPETQIGYAQSITQSPEILAYGDYTLVNSQSITSGAVASTAITTLLNNDLYLDPATVAGTTVTVDSNTTVAQALGNRASNTLTLTAAGGTGATAAVANSQINGASITASATIDVTIGVGQSPGDQVGSTSNGSTYSVTNNTTQALATGNQVINALNASPAAYGTAAIQPGSNINPGGNPQSSATYTVLNSQYNYAPVTATVIGVSPALLPSISTINTGQGGYVVALNGTGSGNVVNMSGNTVTAQAIGNRATNNIVLAALNTGTASTSINSAQLNTGAITASISNVQIGASAPAGTVARVANNQLTASAFGNVVTNSLVTR
jgi:hypothetical protein